MTIRFYIISASNEMAQVVEIHAQEMQEPRFFMVINTSVDGLVMQVSKAPAGMIWTEYYFAGWETSTRLLANASENLVGRVENRTGRVEFCIGYIRDYPVRESAKKFLFPSLFCISGDINVSAKAMVSL